MGYAMMTASDEKGKKGMKSKMKSKTKTNPDPVEMRPDVSELCRRFSLEPDVAKRREMVLDAAIAEWESEHGREPDPGDEAADEEIIALATWTYEALENMRNGTWKA